MTTTDRYDVADVILVIVRDETGNPDATEDSTFAALDVESLTFAEILMDIEDRLGAALGLEEEFALDGGATVVSLIDAVTTRLGEFVDAREG